MRLATLAAAIPAEAMHPMQKEHVGARARYRRRPFTKKTRGYMDLLPSIVSRQSLEQAAAEFASYRWTTGVNAENRDMVEQELGRIMDDLARSVLERKYAPLPLFWHREKVTSKTLHDHALKMFDCMLQQAVYDKLYPIVAHAGAQPFAVERHLSTPEEDLEDYLSSCTSAFGSQAKSVVVLNARLGHGERMGSRISQQFFQTFGDRSLTSLVSKYIAATRNAAAVQSTQGHGSNEPQYSRTTYGPLYHLLQEVALLPLCENLEEKGLAYARHGGEFRIFVANKPKAERHAEQCRKFMVKKLAFDEEDFEIACKRITDPSYWGYSVSYSEGKPMLCMHTDALSQFRHELTHNTSRSYGMISNQQRAVLVSRTVNSYAVHFRYAESIPELEELEEWLCRRIRMDYLKRWKTPKGKIHGLVKFGIPLEEAKIAGTTHLGWWAASDMITVRKALSHAALKSEGYRLPTDTFARHRTQL